MNKQKKKYLWSAFIMMSFIYLLLLLVCVFATPSAELAVTIFSFIGFTAAGLLGGSLAGLSGSYFSLFSILFSSSAGFWIPSLYFRSDASPEFFLLVSILSTIIGVSVGLFVDYHRKKA